MNTSELIQKYVNEISVDPQNNTAGLISIVDNVLYNGNKPIARKASNCFILSKNIDDVDINDALIVNIVKSGADYTRIDDFSTLSNAASRKKDLENGNFDQFKMISNIFGLEYTQEELASIEKARYFVERVFNFYKDVEEKERVARIAAEEASREERERELIADWDAGKGSHRNSRVKGAGGAGLRLRTYQSGTRTYVYTSRGEKTTINVVRRAWDFACEYWYGGREYNRYGTTRAVSRSGYSSRTAEVTENSIAIGCQTISKAEAERFADIQGWPRISELA